MMPVPRLDIRRVLYATDFSAPARRALPVAVRLAREHGAELHLLHVLVLHQNSGSRVEAALSEVEDEVTRRSTGASPGLRNRVRTIRSVRRSISAAHAIAEYASECSLDLVVMGSHGLRGVRRMVLGSVAEEVVAISSAPVLVVRAGAETGEGAYRRILVPIDFSRHSLLALTHAWTLAGLWGARLRLLHVVPQIGLPGVPLPPGEGLEPAALLRTARERLEALASPSSGRDGGPQAEVQAEVEVRAGRPMLEVVSGAADFEADLIVIASHGLVGLERILLGSVTERVLRRTGASVLAIKPFGRRLVPGPSPEEAAARVGSKGRRATGPETSSPAREDGLAPPIHHAIRWGFSAT